jgi:ribulose-phosphate 3-epimerase
MLKVAPSILAADFSRLADEIKRVESAGVNILHIDIMDGHFVPNISFGIPIINSIRKITNMEFDVHLMIEQPEKYIDAFADAGADIITVHAESGVHLHRVVQNIKNKGIKASVALNPATPVSVLEYIINDLDMVLIMSVNPGFGGQKFIEFTIDKIKTLYELKISKGLNFDIEVDGGIDEQNVKKIVCAGANVLVAGSAIFKSKNIKRTIKTFLSV